MKIKIIRVGKIKEHYIVSAIDEYNKRLQKFSKVEFIDICDEKFKENHSPKQKSKIIDIECTKIFQKLQLQDFIISLDSSGTQLSSQNFACMLNSKAIEGVSTFCFIIGGSLGLNSDILKKSNYILSFSKMTFTHQIVQIFLLEQVYRAFKIIHNEPYHK